MTVWMGVLARVAMSFLLPIDLTWQFFLTANINIHLRSRDTAALHSRNFQPGADVQGCDGFFQHARGHSCIHKRAQEHVATYAGKTIEVSYAHDFNSGVFIIGN